MAVRKRLSATKAPTVKERQKQIYEPPSETSLDLTLKVSKVNNPYQWLVGKDGRNLMLLLKTNKVQDERGLLASSLSTAMQRVNGEAERLVVEVATPSMVVIMERNRLDTTAPIRTR